MRHPWHDSSELVELSPLVPRISAQILTRLLRWGEFMQMTELAPLRDDQVAVLVERAAVRGVADAVLPLVRLEAKVGALARYRVVPNLRDDVAFLVQNSPTDLQRGQQRVVATDMNGR